MIHSKYKCNLYTNSSGHFRFANKSHPPIISCSSDKTVHHCTYENIKNSLIGYSLSIVRISGRSSTLLRTILLGTITTFYGVVYQKLSIQNYLFSITNFIKGWANFCTVALEKPTKRHNILAN